MFLLWDPYYGEKKKGGQKIYVFGTCGIILGTDIHLLARLSALPDLTRHSLSPST
jgi:hypothetical protein